MIICRTSNDVIFSAVISPLTIIDGELWIRHEDGNVMSENLLFGEGEPLAGGVSLLGTDHVVANNSVRSLGEHEPEATVQWDIGPDP